ncbi:ABC transporter ATP-binding protein [Nannocystis bainbridge]|uniref:ABC transporter ATP-binding protein n=1 Tax=Nannocystis bainbridge TaxID=2995303 RepID=A0ABT5E3Q8_9BACT|nr:ABC transporter ATP-binding protein [Nannocystis bainbridge]MDC0720505.1 ABC transporter ATP-binding protein [Nannocystis bainbridge]
MSGSAILVEALGKRFGAMQAVDGVSFSVEPGEIFGFMGHNGAGKTTTLRMLLGLTRPTGGRAAVLGHDVVAATLEVRRVCGYLPASYALPPDMTPREFLQYVAAMFAIPRATARARGEALLRRFGLEAVADRKLRGFSTGMTQKVGLAQALINEPRVLLLDEPTSGLDPLGRHELLEHLRALAQQQGVTVMFSSHILSDVETLCRRVAAMHHARLIACGEIAALKREHGATTMDELYLELVRRHAS